MVDRDASDSATADGTSASDVLRHAAAADVQATFCATLVDEWLRLGVRHAVVAPGSRSTPMALALADRPEIALQVVHDERVAAFVALGIGTATGGRPALLLCTSGTAAANFFPAVVEAGLSEIPMIVLTADRPDELRGVGAPQTIDQIDLYGRHVRWSDDPGVPDAEHADEWRGIAATTVRESVSGPVQLNLAFREPLVGAALALPAADGALLAVDDEPVDSGDPAPVGFDQQRGVILLGGGGGVDPTAVAALSTMTSWPIIADPMSAGRVLDGVVSTADALLRHEDFARDHAPDVVVRIGRPSASKVVAQWSARPGVTMIQVGGPGRIDPDHNVSAVCTIETLLAASPVGASGTTWSARWLHAERQADAAIEQVLATEVVLSEPGAARTLSAHRPDGSSITVSSSMPVRDLEWFGGTSASAHANRGANGIDGVMSTALGRALARASDSGREPEFVLIGDLAFVHDVNALVALTSRGVDLRVIVVDNDGGGIFSFLPQATTPGGERFERLFGTPLDADVLGLAAAHGITTSTVTTRAELIDWLGRPGPWVVRVPSDRATNVDVHRRLNAAVAAALS